MPELKRALGTEVDVTVFRKLRVNRKQIASTKNPDRNQQAFVENSSAGHFAEEVAGTLPYAPLRM
jgi:hypothetical protein